MPTRSFRENKLHGREKAGILRDYKYPADYLSKSSNVCDSVAEFSLQRHQRSAAEHVKSTGSALIFHGLGSGKTCTSVATAELFKKYDVKGELIDKDAAKQVIICCPAKIVATYEKEIAEECARRILVDGVPQGYSTPDDIAFLRREEAGMRSAIADPNQKRGQNDLKKARKRFEQRKMTILGRISQSYHIVSHDKMYLGLYAKGTKEPGRYTEKGGALTKPNTLLIIDEIQNLVSLDATSKKYAAFYDALTYYAHANMRIMLMSATPIFNRGYEIALTLNLLRPKIPFPTTEVVFNEMFGSGDGDIENPELFKLMAGPNVSYFAGGNPAAYPYVINAHIDGEMSDLQQATYGRTLLGEITKNFNSKKRIFGMGMEDEMKKTGSDKGDLVSLFIKSQQVLMCNKKALLPGLRDIRKLLGDTVTERNRASPEKVLDNQKKMLEHIKKHSIKFWNVITLMQKTKKPVFVYMTWVESGTNEFKACLEYLGMTEFNGRTKSPDTTFAVWTGKTKDADAELIKEGFNKGNISIIVSTIQEGISFLKVGQVHIVTPWWNENRLKQVAARAVRFKSHCGLPEKERYVHVFYHLAFMPEKAADGTITDAIQKHILKVIGQQQLLGGKKGTKDKVNQQAAVKAALQAANNQETSQLNARERPKGIGIRQLGTVTLDQVMDRSARIKTAKIVRFETLLKEAAVDAELNDNANVVQLRETYVPYIKRGENLRLFKNPNTSQLYTTEKAPIVKSADILKVTEGKDSAFNNRNTIQLYEVTKTDKGQYLKGKKATFKGLLYKESDGYSKVRSSKNLESLQRDVPAVRDLVNMGKILHTFRGKSKSEIRKFIRRCLRKHDKEDMANQLQGSVREKLYKILKTQVYRDRKSSEFKTLVSMWDALPEKQLIEVVKESLLAEKKFEFAFEGKSWRLMAKAHRDKMPQ